MTLDVELDFIFAAKLVRFYTMIQRIVGEREYLRRWRGKGIS